MASLGIIFSILSVSVIINGHIRSVEAQLKPIGICYGMVADNLPSPADVIGMFKQYNIGKLRSYKPDPQVLNALKGTGIEVILGVANEDLPNIATGIAAAQGWIDANVKPYYPDVAFRYISAGNEVIPGDLSGYVSNAITNLQSVLLSNGMKDVLVTTAVAMNVLGTSYPPSAGAFSEATRGNMISVLHYLSQAQAPLMIHAYPYFAYASDPVNIRLDYAQFTAPGPVVTDGPLKYQNMLDAMVDAFYFAMEREGFASTGVIVAETGWPSAGNSNLTTLDLAKTYNENWAKKILAREGTPKRPSSPIDGYIFAMFNEDQKPAGVEQNWGLFYPNKSPVYAIF